MLDSVFACLSNTVFLCLSVGQMVTVSLSVSLCIVYLPVYMHTYFNVCGVQCVVLCVCAVCCVVLCVCHLHHEPPLNAIYRVAHCTSH
jgi:hypothetical protein